MKRKTRIIGVDFGLKRIGLSISDESKMLATPFQTLTCEKKLEQTIAVMIQQIEKDQQNRDYEVAEVVVGMPLMMNGSKGFLADEVNYFIDMLQQKTIWNVVTWDERLTSVQAERSMMEGSFSRKKRSQKVDAVAAVIILQNYLDSKSLREYI